MLRKALSSYAIETDNVSATCAMPKFYKLLPLAPIQRLNDTRIRKGVQRQRGRRATPQAVGIGQSQVPHLERPPHLPWPGQAVYRLDGDNLGRIAKVSKLLAKSVIITVIFFQRTSFFLVGGTSGRFEK